VFESQNRVVLYGATSGHEVTANEFGGELAQ